MAGKQWLLDHFEEDRTRLWELAYGMLGSVADADDALQDAWVRASRAELVGIQNPRGWLTTVVSRVCLNALRSREVRREERPGVWLPDPVVRSWPPRQPDDEFELAQSVGLALLVVLEALSPAERIAFVLHDVFGLPHAEIARILDRSPEAARKLASRARHRVREAEVPDPDPDLAAQRDVVDAFLHAARAGDLERLLELLDPSVVLRVDFGPGRPEASEVVRGARSVAQRARAAPDGVVHAAIVNGEAGAITTDGERAVVVMAFTVRGRRIVAIEGFADPERVAGIVKRWAGREARSLPE